MKILLWHGYLLTGSGSNLYTANIARVWRNAGHDVLLMCQEHAPAPNFVDEIGDFDKDNARFQVRPTGAAPSAGRVTLVRPSIGRTLPVYVYDEYAGFEAKRYVDLDDMELTRYTQANVAALTTALRAHEPDAIITGHEVMGPYIARQACGGLGYDYLAKLHGSALEYAVKKQERYRDFAEKGLGGASVVAGGSRYMLDEASAMIPGWRDRAVIVNPGCDVELFMPLNQRPSAPPTVGYVGKLIAAKGVHNLLTALGLTTTPDLQAIVVGYGGFEAELRSLWDHLSSGDMGAAAALARAGDGKPLTKLVEWLDGDARGAGYARRWAEIPVTFPGRLEHGPLSKVLPTFDVLVVPSEVPEAFGMVAAEAAASGVLPVVPAHSGIGEAGATLERELGVPGLLTFDPDHPIEGIAAVIDRILSIPAAERRDLGRAAAGTARKVWSWERVADQLLTHARG